MKRIIDHVVLVCLLFGMITITGCKKEVTLPILTTNSASNVTINSVKSGGNITKSGGADVTARGVCWSTSRNPVVTGSHSSDGNGTGSFDATITGLTPNTLYYIRAYATNSAGTGYGNEISVTTTALTVPVLTTVAATAVLQTTAVSGGNISADGGAAVTARGICWSASADPTTANDKTTDGTGTGTFASNMAGLTAGTTYHVRAYATNSVGTAYGSEITFTTSALAVPTLTTSEITAITLTTASSGGNVTSDGGATVTVRGICWSKTANPTISNDKTTDGTGTGVFASLLASLEPGTKYYVRSYATNSIGTGYGNELSFDTSPVTAPVLTTTPASTIGITTAVAGGVITSDGGAAVTAKGVCWSLTASPTIANSKSDGTGNGTFTSNITGLLPLTTYYLRAWATNSAGTAYGNETTFTTLAIAVPSLTTAAATLVTMTTATSGGNVTADGGGTISARGVCYATTTAPTLSNTVVTSGSGLGTFISNLTALLPATTYYLRAYATNAAGTGFGTEITFTTSASVVPTLTTAVISAITMTSATSGGSISSDGGAAISEKGICWATTASPTISNSKTSDGTGTAAFTSSLTALLPGTVYHVRAFATNSAGTAYGNDVQFTTTAVSVPTIATTVVSSLNTTSAVSGGSITNNGGATVTQSGICWSTIANPTISDPRTTDGTPTGSFASTMTGLTMATTYYVRAYATNSAGTAYGNQIMFDTKVSDIEGNVYGVVTIGAQVWMTENLRTATLSTGTAIPNVTDNLTWSTLSTMAYSWYNNDVANKPLYGGLYNWFTVNTGNLCPSGWRVPAESDFSALELYMGMTPAEISTGWAWRGTDQGTRLKNTSGWGAGLNGTNTTGFAALPGGYRYAVDGTFNNYADLAYWWSSTEVDAGTAWYRRMDGNQTGIYKGGVFKIGGKFVRCMKN